MKSRPNKQPAGSIHAIVVLLTSVLILGSCRTFSTPVIRTITAETLSDKYGISVESARREFDGHDLLVEGYVMRAVVLPKKDDREGMVLLGSADAAVHGVECWFTRYESSEFAGLAPGNVVTVKGTFNGEAGPMLKFCKLVKGPAGTIIH